MTSFPQLKLAFVNIFQNSELHRFKIQNGFPGFTAFQAIEFCYTVCIKCSEAWRGEHAYCISWHRGSQLLSSGVKTVVMFFSGKDSKWKRPSLYCSQKEKRKKNQSNPRPLEYIWVWCGGEALCPLCPERFFTLYLGPIKYITYLFHVLFPKEKKRGGHSIQRLCHEKGSRRCLIYAVMSNFGHGTSESYFPPPSF